MTIATNESIAPKDAESTFFDFKVFAQKRLFSFAYMKDFEESIERLAEMAIPEKWSFSSKQETAYGTRFPVLRNYIFCTFAKLEEEGKIIEKNIGGVKHAIFNTGLLTATHHEEIYAFFQQHRSPEAGSRWFFLGFFKESDKRIGGIGRPEMASFFSSIDELVFDADKELMKNLDHIIDDNLYRFPQEYRERTPHELRIIVDGAINHAIKKAKRDYKIVTPQFFDQKIQLLLPLCFKDSNKADLALVVNRDENLEAYYCSTCLTLEMAYSNARVIARLDGNTWLKPE